VQFEPNSAKLAEGRQSPLYTTLHPGLLLLPSMLLSRLLLELTLSLLATEEEEEEGEEEREGGFSGSVAVAVAVVGSASIRTPKDSRQWLTRTFRTLRRPRSFSAEQRCSRRVLIALPAKATAAAAGCPLF